VRNGADTLKEALDSLLAQTVQDFEVVVVDDGSTDDSFAIASSTGDDRVRVLRRPAAGLVAALNHGLVACRAPLVARMDADDRCENYRLQRQLPLLEQHTVVDGQVRFVGDVAQGMRRYEAWINSVTMPADFDRSILIESPIVHPAATFRRDAVLEIGGYRHGDFPEDYDLWCRLHAAGHSFAKVPEVLIEMAEHGRRLTHTDPRYGRAAFRRVRQDWLAAGPLNRSRRVVLWGAGKEAAAWLRFLLEGGHSVAAIVDIAPKRLGHRRHGVEIIPPQALPSIDAEICLVNVGGWGVRDKVRDNLTQLRPHWREGSEWWAVR
jgi:glycosyltransferase involved in cell wall biosynthesis